jgi:hypothetical protein
VIEQVLRSRTVVRHIAEAKTKGLDVTEKVEQRSSGKEQVDYNMTTLTTSPRSRACSAQQRTTKRRSTEHAGNMVSRWDGAWAASGQMGGT